MGTATLSLSNREVALALLASIEEAQDSTLFLKGHCGTYHETFSRFVAFFRRASRP